MSEAESREELRLAKALSRVKAPVRSSSSPAIKTSSPAPSKPSFQELKRLSQKDLKKPPPEPPLAKPPLVQTQTSAPQQLSDRELELRCMEWLQKVRPLLLEQEEVEFLGFEVGEEMSRKSPRVVK